MTLSGSEETAVVAIIEKSIMAVSINHESEISIQARKVFLITHPNSLSFVGDVKIWITLNRTINQSAKRANDLVTCRILNKNPSNWNGPQKAKSFVISFQAILAGTIQIHDRSLKNHSASVQTSSVTDDPSWAKLRHRPKINHIHMTDNHFPRNLFRLTLPILLLYRSNVVVIIDRNFNFRVVVSR